MYAASLSPGLMPSTFFVFFLAFVATARSLHSIVFAGIAPGRSTHSCESDANTFDPFPAIMISGNRPRQVPSTDFPGNFSKKVSGDRDRGERFQKIVIVGNDVECRTSRVRCSYSPCEEHATRRKVLGQRVGIFEDGDMVRGERGGVRESRSGSESLGLRDSRRLGGGTWYSVAVGGGGRFSEGCRKVAPLAGGGCRVSDWCERGELNPHGCDPLDPKSSASASSATLADVKERIPQCRSASGAFRQSPRGVMSTAAPG
jgi:hypothetical protein